MDLLFSNTLHRFSKQQRLPVWLQTFESVKYSTDITASFVRSTSYQIQVSLPLILWCNENFTNIFCSYFSYFCDSPWQNLRVAGSSCRGSPQWDGQQLRETLQSLSRRAQRPGMKIMICHAGMNRSNQFQADYLNVCLCFYFRWLLQQRNQNFLL